MIRALAQGRAALLPFAVALACLAIGASIAAALDDPTLVNARSAGFAALVISGVAALLTFHWTRRSHRAAAGPGVLLAAAALAGAALLGLVNGGVGTASLGPDTAPYFGVGVVALLTAGLLTGRFGSSRTTKWPDEMNLDPFSRPAVTLAAVAIISLAVLNLATGSVPIFSENVDDTRFRGGGGALPQLWVWIIGGVEWVVLLAAVVLIARRHASRLLTCAAGSGMLVLIALAGRSFLLLVGLAAIIVLATVGRLSLPRLLVIATTGLLVLGLVGVARIEASDPTGERREYLQENNLSGVGGIISQSASTGPWVFGNSLEQIPDKIPFQGGAFFLRDFRAQLPLVLRPERGDLWVTDTILQRDPLAIGGSPPTLVGGLYIDFGIPGIVIGCLLIGIVLTRIFEWARTARTFGALALYGYLAAYVALSAYSYVSLKPAVVTVVVFCLLTHRMERGLQAAVPRLAASGPLAEPCRPS